MAVMNMYGLVYLDEGGVPVHLNSLELEQLYDTQIELDSRPLFLLLL